MVNAIAMMRAWNLGYNCHGQTVFWPRPTHNEA